jgi:hypothetical protein
VDVEEFVRGWVLRGVVVWRSWIVGSWVLRGVVVWRSWIVGSWVLWACNNAISAVSGGMKY